MNSQTSTRIRKRLAFAVFPFFAYASGAYAAEPDQPDIGFEVYGLSVGMTQTDIIALAKEKGWAARRAGEYQHQHRFYDAEANAAIEITYTAVEITYTAVETDPAAVTADSLVATRIEYLKGFDPATRFDADLLIADLAARYGTPAYVSPPALQRRLDFRVSGPAEADVVTACRDEMVAGGMPALQAQGAAGNAVALTVWQHEGDHRIRAGCPGTLPLFNDYLAASLAPVLGVGLHTTRRTVTFLIDWPGYVLKANYERNRAAAEQRASAPSGRRD